MDRIVERFLSIRFFARRDESDRFLDILVWWESRRLPYNLLVGVTGLITCGIILAIATLASKQFHEPLSLPDPPFVAVAGILLYGIGANACYSGGWLTEWLARKIWKSRAGAYGEIAFFFGLFFSILLTLVPAAATVAVYLVRLAFA